jgi:hypothetical protein
MQLSRKEFLTVTTIGALGSVAAASVFDRAEAGPRVDTDPLPTDEKKGNDIKGITSAVVDFIATADLRAFSPDVIGMGRRCLIDGLGVILAGSTVHGSGIVRDYVKSATEKAEATVLGPETFVASSALAALANGASGHAMDWDDTQLSRLPGGWLSLSVCRSPAPSFLRLF